jgi:hypothetical protein
MRKDKGKKPLSVEEMATVLGADHVEPLPGVRMDPISLMALATRIGGRLAGKRAQSAEKSPETTRQIGTEEGAALLGAEQPEDIGDIASDPVKMKIVFETIARRLMSKGGRPTDPSWNISRKVPMKNETWERLKHLSEALGKGKVRVAPGQLAAIAIERGLPSLIDSFQDQFELKPTEKK